MVDEVDEAVLHSARLQAVDNMGDQGRDACRGRRAGCGGFNSAEQIPSLIHESKLARRSSISQSITDTSLISCSAAL